MADIKLILTDLDGTFLSHEDDGSLPVNIEAVKAAQRAGIVVYPCTGRSWLQSNTLVPQMGFDNLIVTNNGASIVEMDSGKTIYQDCLSRDMAQTLLDIGEAYHAHRIIPQVACPDFMGFFAADKHIEHELSSRYGLQIDGTGGIRFYRTAAEMGKAGGASVELVRYIAEPKDVPQAMMDDLHKLQGIEITWSYRLHLDVMKQGVSKGSVIPYLCERHNIRPENVMALGDQDNDASMIASAGIGIAMAAASKKAAAAADHITDRVENCGFAKAIYRYALHDEQQAFV